MTNEQKVRLGIFLTMATVLFLILAGFFIIPKIHEPGDDYYIDFRDISVHGLYVGSTVQYRGVEVGKVTRMTVNPKDLDSVLVFIKIRKGIIIKRDMTAILTYTGLTGQKYVEIGGGSVASPELPVGGEIPTGKGLGEKAEDIVVSVESVINKLNDLLSEENEKNITKFLKNVKDTSAVLSGVMESKRKTLEEAISDFQEAAANLSRASGNLPGLTENMNRTVVNIEADSRKVLANVNERLSERELGKTIEETQKLLATANSTIKKLDNLLGSRGEELDALIRSLSETAENLARVTRDISEDPSIIIRGRREKK